MSSAKSLHALSRAQLEARLAERAREELERRSTLTLGGVDAERRLEVFVRQAWDVLEPATTYIDGWHIGCKCEYLEAVTLGQITRLIINEPPRYMKSIVVSVCWPVWEWGPKKRPHLRYLFSSYSSELSVKHSVDRRTIIRSGWYRQNWGSLFAITDDNDRKTEFENDRRGVMSTTSTGGTATGKGGNRVIVDDPVNPLQALSEVEREGANKHFDQTLYTRLNDKRADAIVVVMQRLHQTDLTGHLIEEKKEEGWVHLNLQAVAEKRTFISLPISGKERVREVGDILWREREDAGLLAKTKVSLGSYAYSGQYQQTPAPSEGGIIKRAWFRRFDSRERPPTFDQIILSADPKFKDFETASRVALHVWGRIGPNKYLLARDIGHFGIVESLAAIARLRADWHRPADGLTLDAYLIEDKANGPAIVQVMQKKVAGVIAWPPRGSKEARIIAVSPQMEAGNIWIPLEPWGDEVIDALCFVPNGDNWDDVDACSQALDYFGRSDDATASQLFGFGSDMSSAQQQWPGHN
jgi:predicted phage terminase large subunit-like protein